MIGSKEFKEYADKANIPNSYRIWCYALWREAQKQREEELLKGMELLAKIKGVK